MYIYHDNMPSVPNLNFFEIHTRTLGASALIYEDARFRSSLLPHICHPSTTYIIEMAKYNNIQFYLTFTSIIPCFPPGKWVPNSEPYFQNLYIFISSWYISPFFLPDPPSWHFNQYLGFQYIPSKKYPEMVGRSAMFHWLPLLCLRLNL